jgi:ATP/maltotriose-dependent transcriptional regulator MalT
MLAKISPPKLSRVLERRRLLRRLDAARRAGLVWVMGPPGAGKTTLVASWLAARRLRPAWLQLDRGDGDVATFFHGLERAVSARARGAALPAFGPESLAAPADFARRFFRTLAHVRRGPPVIVLDDWHELPADSPVHAALREGLAELPATVAVVFTSREEPPPSLARWRARGRLHVVAAAELPLTVREAARVAHLRARRAVAPRAVASLHALTEGWAGGLVLLLAGHDAGAPPSSQLRDAGVLDYFSDEVFARTDPGTRRVLLETATLPRIDAETAVALTGEARAGEILDELARRGQFVSRHGAPPTYAFHVLFRQFLLRRAADEVPPARLAEVRRAAAAHLAAAGAAEDAVELLLGAGAWADAARAIAAVAPQLLAAGRGGPLARWILAVPDEVRGRDPWLLLWLGAALSLRDLAEARRLLERAFDALRSAGDADGQHLAWSLVTETFLYELDEVSGLDRWIAELDRMRRDLPPPRDPALAARVAAVAFGALMNRQPWRPELRAFEEESLAIALGTGPAEVRLAAGRGLALYYGWWAADLHRARLLQDALAPLTVETDAASAIFWAVAEASVAVHAGRLGDGERAVARGLAVARRSGVRRWDPFLHGIRTWIALARGDLDAAVATLRPILAGAGSESRLARCMYHHLACMVARAQGHADVAEEHGRVAVESTLASGLAPAQAGARTVAALATQGSRRAAALRDALEFARRCRLPNAEVACLVGLALEELRAGDDAAIRAALQLAFGVARRHGTRAFTWLTRDELAACCAAALERDVEPALAREIVLSLRLAPPPGAVALETWPWDLRVEALGGLRIVRGGEQVASGRKAQKKPLETLRLLVVAGPRGLGQEALAEALWPDADGDAARHALKTTLYRLRKLLGRPGAVSQRDGRVALDGRVVFVDAWALERHLGGLAPGDAAARRERVRALYHGDLFGPGADDPALAAARDALQRRVARFLGAAPA